jgi:hypothetical protein
VFVALQNSAPVGGGFWVVRTRCKIAPPVKHSLAQRAIKLYSALEATFAAPSFSAPVGDALNTLPTKYNNNKCIFVVVHD